MADFKIILAIFPQTETVRSLSYRNDTNRRGIACLILQSRVIITNLNDNRITFSGIFAIFDVHVLYIADSSSSKAPYYCQIVISYSSSQGVVNLTNVHPSIVLNHLMYRTSSI